LVAVSKFHSSNAIRDAYVAGQRHFAENYAQHLRDKSLDLADLKDIVWHYIGNLQKNKIKYIIGANAVLETVDSIDLVKELEISAAKNQHCIECLVQINIGNESQKSGVAAESVESVLQAIEGASHLQLKGLMIIPPWDIEPEESRKYFKKLRQIRDCHGGATRLPMLSMGMSDSFEQAIEEGSTIVRVGTAIFGSRQ